MIVFVDLDHTLLSLNSTKLFYEVLKDQNILKYYKAKLLISIFKSVKIVFRRSYSISSIENALVSTLASKHVLSEVKKKMELNRNQFVIDFVNGLAGSPSIVLVSAANQVLVDLVDFLPFEDRIGSYHAGRGFLLKNKHRIYTTYSSEKWIVISDDVNDFVENAKNYIVFNEEIYALCHCKKEI
jgi:hypothetical protein